MVLNIAVAFIVTVGAVKLRERVVGLWPEKKAIKDRLDPFVHKDDCYFSRFLNQILARLITEVPLFIPLSANDVER